MMVRLLPIESLDSAGCGDEEAATLVCSDLYVNHKLNLGPGSYTLIGSAIITYGRPELPFLVILPPGMSPTARSVTSHLWHKIEGSCPVWSKSTNGGDDIAGVPVVVESRLLDRGVRRILVQHSKRCSMALERANPVESPNLCLCRTMFPRPWLPPSDRCRNAGAS